MDWIKKQDPQVVKWLALSMFGLACLFIYFANRTSPPVDVILIILGVVDGVIGFALWLAYGDLVDRGPRR